MKRSGATDTRFDEAAAGNLYWAGADLFLVRCPRCGACASVRRSGPRWSVASGKLTCDSCGLAKERAASSWQGPVIAVARCRCGDCGRTLASEMRQLRQPPRRRAAQLPCDRCGHVTETTLDWAPFVAARPFDPLFGLPLWLQAPCSKSVLWAYNRPHLEFLRQYVTASLRERQPNLNRSLASRIPRWIKEASRREAIVKCIERLAAT
jgi:transcription elongation factor Elf1